MLSPLRAIKSDKYCYCYTQKSNNYIESIQEKKQRTKTKNKTKNIKNKKVTRSNREKCNNAKEPLFD